MKNRNNHRQKIITLIFFTIINFSIYGEEFLLERACHADGGQIVESLTCPQSKVERVGGFCILENNSFYNGCSASIGGYGDIFFAACRVHDFCYHHEPASYGKQKSTCDKEFYQNMQEICQNRNDLNYCYYYANLFYYAVDKRGQKSWDCSNSEADYIDLL